MSVTPTLEAHINNLIDKRLRQMQTSFPAEVVSYNAADSTVTVKPMFVETWRDADDVRIEEPIEGDQDQNIENVIVAFPRAGSFRMTYPITAGDTGIVIVTKYSLERFRAGAGMVDPGDLRKFGMAGSVFFPVNVTPDGAALDGEQGDGDTDIYLGEGGASDYLALKADVDDIKTFIDGHQATYNGHVHIATSVSDMGVTTTTTMVKPAAQSSEVYTPTYSADVKVESN